MFHMRDLGFTCVKPEGAFYIMMNIEKLIGTKLYGVEITDSDVFANLLLEKGLVAVVPGSGFGAPHFCRWSYATSMENIRLGLDRLEKFLKEGREYKRERAGGFYRRLVFMLIYTRPL